MKILECACVVALLCLSTSKAQHAPPKVEVYSRLPGLFGNPNTLICHVTGFHPPEIKIELLKNQQVIPQANQTDLAFETNWHYHLTKHVLFTPQKGETFGCSVIHMGVAKMYIWEPDM
ncbi:b2m [Pungitius sinensis]